MTSLCLMSPPHACNEALLLLVCLAIRLACLCRHLLLVWVEPKLFQVLFGHQISASQNRFALSCESVYSCKAEYHVQWFHGTCSRPQLAWELYATSDFAMRCCDTCMLETFPHASHSSSTSRSIPIHTTLQVQLGQLSAFCCIPGMLFQASQVLL